MGTLQRRSCRQICRGGRPVWSAITPNRIRIFIPKEVTTAKRSGKMFVESMMFSVRPPVATNTNPAAADPITYIPTLKAARRNHDARSALGLSWLIEVVKAVVMPLNRRTITPARGLTTAMLAVAKISERETLLKRLVEKSSTRNNSAVAARAENTTSPATSEGKWAKANRTMARPRIEKKVVYQSTNRWRSVLFLFALKSRLLERVVAMILSMR